MSINDFQQFTRTTVIYDPKNALTYLGLGLTSEAGEVAGKIKKLLRDGQFDKNALALELGDALYYIVRIADELGFTGEDIIDVTTKKLESRKQRNVISGSGDYR